MNAPRRPKFSVVVPTRQRHDTLYHTMRTVLMQDHDSYELVVVDNKSSAETAEVVQGFQDPRVRYVRSETRLAMSDNWELGLSHAAGDYVLILGDDDGLVPGAFNTAEQLFEQSGLSVLGWDRPHYFWPNALATWLRDRYYFNVANQAGVVEAQDVLRRFYAYETTFNSLPMIYNAFVHRSVIAAVKARTGRYFEDLNPDVYSGIVNAHVAGRYLYTSQGLSIAGVSGHSTGASFSGAQGEGSSAGMFMEEQRTSKLTLAPHPLLIDSTNQDILVAGSLLRAKDLFFPDDDAVRLDIGGLLRYMANRLNQERAAYDEAARALLALAEKHHVAIAAEHLPPKSAAPARAPVGLFGPHVWLDCKPLGVTNVYEAAQTLGAIRQFSAALTPAAALPTPAAAVGEPACSIVMTLGNHLALTQRALHALAEHTPGELFEVILVDNGSSDGTAEFLACLEGDLRVHTNARPVGDAQAKNQGAALARGRFLVFLDAEAVPADGWLQGLLAEAEGKPHVAVVGAKILSSATGLVLHAGVEVAGDGLAITGRGLPAHAPAVSAAADREMVAGTCMLIRRATFVSLGGFSTATELDDLDLCMRAREAGLGVRFAASSVLWMDELQDEETPAPPDASRSPGSVVGASAPIAPQTDTPARVLYHAPIYDPSGYADEARHFILELEALGMPVAARPIGRHSPTFEAQMAPEVRQRLDRAQVRLVEPDFISLIHFPGGALQRLPQAAYRVGRTMFETDGLPADWVTKCNVMDEIWVPTEFNRETFRRAGVTSRLEVVPGGVDTDRFRPGLNARRMAGTRGTVFLSIFEWSYRKGWDVLLKAWAEAFGPEADVSLVLRTYALNQTEGSQDMDASVTQFLRESLGLARHQVAPIVVLHDQVPDAEMPGLFAAASAYVAPSRGEGWGRPQMEAMACGLPVIATRWSGNMAFMTDENSLLLDIEGVLPVDDRAEMTLYHGQRWAEPSIAHLVALLRRVVDEPEAMREIGARARKDVATRWRWDQAAAIAARRLLSIEAELAGRPPAPPIPADALPVRWEGAELNLHSFAHVNREVVRRLIASGRVEVAAVSIEPTEFKPDAALVPVERALGHRLTRPAAVTVRHQWPPDFKAPEEGAWVMMQPWEYGGLPDEWVAGMRDGVDEMWVYTSWLRDCYIKSGLPADRVHVVPLGVEVDRFRPEGPRYPLKTDKRFKFLFVGGAIPRKGVDVLLEAYLSAFTADDDVCLVIKGIGAQTFYRNSAGLHDVISELATSDNPRLPAIEYLDAPLSDDEVAAVYRACDALVHPYRGEGFGLPMAEAMATGLPVIVTGAGAAMDFCDAETAYLIPAREVPIPGEELGLSSTGYWWAEPDREALAALMRQVAADPEAARRVGERARARIVSDFNWDRVAEVVLTRLQGLAGRMPVRFSPPAPFRPGLAPWRLDEHRAVVFFHQADWRGDGWRQVVSAYLTAFNAQSDTTLVLWHDPNSGLPAEQVGDRIMMLIDELGHEPAQTPDLLLVTDPLDESELARLYTAADWVVPAGDWRQAERARLVGRRVLEALTPEAWRVAALGSAQPTL